MFPPPDSIIRPAVDRLLLSPPDDAVETVSTAFGRGTVATTDAVWIISEGVMAHDVGTGALSLPAEALAEAVRAAAAGCRRSG